MNGERLPVDGDLLIREVRSRHPRLRDALVADAQVTAAHRFERHQFRSRFDAVVQILRLMWASDAFLAQALYRVKARLQTLGVPVLPRLAHGLAMAIAQVSIGDPVLIHPGVYIVHGQVVIDGFVEIHSGAVISPFVSIGLQGNDLMGPAIEANVSVGTGARVLGRLRVGAGAKIGANAVVTDDVGESTIVVGVPARPIAPSVDPASRGDGERER
jgi:serine O-acetyltransferase